MKKNTRVEALMFLEFLGQMVATLIERELRQKMVKNQVLRLFENQNSHALYENNRLIRQFADPLTPVQSQILQLLSISTATYAPGK